MEIGEAPGGEVKGPPGIRREDIGVIVCENGHFKSVALMGGDDVEDHPTPTTLEVFLRGALSIGETKVVISHLLGGCSRCRQAMESSSQALFFPGRSEAEGSGAEYDFPIFRAINQARRGSVEQERPESVQSPGLIAKEERPVGVAPHIASGLRSPDGCEALLSASRELRHQDPEVMVFLASLAVGVSERLDARTSAPVVADLRARAWAELGNARRVANDLTGAEAALERSLAAADEGSGEPLLLARLFDLTASLYTDQRRFDKALTLLDRVFEIYWAHGERHLAGRALISKGVSVGFGNQPEEALRLISAGLDLLDIRRDPALALVAIHNLIDFTVKLERFAEGERLLRASRRLYYEYADELNFLKLRWVEGKISAGLGNLTRAEAAFQEVRDGFRAHEMPYHLAVASLDLAGVWLAEGRTTEMRELVEEMVGTFQAFGIHREAIAAVLMLQEAVVAEQATAALLRTVASQLQRLQHEPIH
jgi:tetratricopeptide (TPR) repeat protein